jgi:uncharacterized protein DUF3854
MNVRDSSTQSTDPTSTWRGTGPRQPIGDPLTGRDFAWLEASWITPELAEAAGLRRVDSFTGREIIGHKGKANCAGILFPYTWPGSPQVRDYRLRRDEPELELQPDGTYKEKGKYLSAPGQRPMLYFAPETNPDWLEDVNLPVVIVEGEKKTLALSRLAVHQCEKSRFLSLGIAGVWGFRGRVGKATGPNGERVDVKGPLPDLDRLKWQGRVVIILFDTNVKTNDSVRAARRELTRVLQQRGARLRWAEFPDEFGK